MDNEQLKNRIATLERQMQEMQNLLRTHQHSGTDTTLMLRKQIQLDRDQQFNVGIASHLTQIYNYGTSSEIQLYAVGVGDDSQVTGFTNKSNNLQLDFVHQPYQTVSSIRGYRKPLATSALGTSISVSSGGNTVTIAGFNFTTNELAGAKIAIFNSSGTLIETQTITSNTATVVTISGTWISSTSGGKFLIYKTVLFGDATVIWQRVYVDEGTEGGIRFGVGPTWTSGTAQNGLLYMDPAGDIYWRNKSGASTKLN